MYAEISQKHGFFMSLYNKPQYIVFEVHWFFLSPISISVVRGPIVLQYFMILNATHIELTE